MKEQLRQVRVYLKVYLTALRLGFRMARSAGQIAAGRQYHLCEGDSIKFDVRLDFTDRRPDKVGILLQPDTSVVCSVRSA